MSTYTTELRYIVENAAGLTDSVGYSKINDILTSATMSKVMPDYPIFDETYRDILNAKIIKHYYVREICCETVGLWRLYLDSKMNEIMPFYNKMYESELLKYDPLTDYTITKKQKGFSVSGENRGLNGKENNAYNSNSQGLKSTEQIDLNQYNEGRNSDTNRATTGNTNDSTKSNRIGSNNTEQSGTTTGTSTSTNKDAYSETPQGTLSNIEDNTYLTNARITNTQSSTNDASTNHTDNISNENYNESKENQSNLNEEQHENNVVNGSTNRTNKVNDSTSNIENNVNSRVYKTEENRTLNSTSDYIESLTGKTSGKSYPALIQDLRDSFINIDVMIINELSDLFMRVW